MSSTTVGGLPRNWTIDRALAHCRESITKGSKSFSLAARLFDAETRDAAFCLYGWCRYADDIVDGSDHGFRDGSPASGSGLGGLVRETREACAGRPADHPVFVAFSHVVRRYGIPLHYPLELLEGMAMDRRGDHYETLDDVSLYAYRVAGTVGLMMSHIMGLEDERALRNACDMGIAMQLTNIARDVIDDHALGRVYLPADWLREAGLAGEDVASPAHRSALAAVVSRLLAEAERRYRSGEAGLPSLSFRAACAVGAARRVYGEIGRTVRRRGARAWDTRTIVPAAMKLLMIGRGVSDAALSRLRRRSAWKRRPITRVWRQP